MPAFKLIVGPTGTQGTGTNADYSVYFDENIQDGTLIGTLGGIIDPNIQSMVWRPTANNENRFYTITKNASGVWEIRVAAGQGGNVNFSWETGTLRAQDIHFDAYSGPDGTGTILGSGDFTINLNDLNEAPLDITYKGAPTTNPKVGVTQAGATIVDADAIDPDSIGKPQFRGNNFKFGAGTASAADVTVDVSGLYKIDPTTGIITTLREMTAADAGAKALKIVVYDTTTPSIAYEEDYLFTVDPGAEPNTAPSNVRWSTGGAVAENSGTDVTVGMVTADDDGGAAGLRYSIGANANFDIDAATGRIFVKNGAALNYEGTNTYTVAVTATDTNGTGLSTTQNLTITLTDVNEAPTDLTFGTQQTVQAGATQNGANVIQATWVDPDGAASGFRNNKYAFLVNGNLVLADGKFTINETTGQVTTNAAITAADVGTKTLQVVAYDAGNNALRHVEAKDITIAAAANTAPPDPTAAKNVNERSPDGTEVLSMAATDGDGQTLSYTFASAQDAAHKISLDGKFRIEGNKIVVNGSLSEVTQDTSLPFYAVVANDGSGAPNGTVTGNVSITVKNVPILSIAPVTTGPVDEGDTGFVDYVFRVTRDSTGTTSSATWTVTGTGIDANDFQALTGTVDFTNTTDTFKDIVLKVRADRVAELAENFTITLSNASVGSAISTTNGSANGSITDDDHAPTFAVLAGQGSHSGDVGTAIVDVLKGVDLQDLDGDELTLTVEFFNTNGTLNGMATGGGVIVTDDGTSTGGFRQYTLKGTAANIETLLAAVTFTAASNGQTDFTFTLSDGANPLQTFTNAVAAVGTVPNNPPPPTPSGMHFVHEGKTDGFVVKTLPLQDGGVDIVYTFENPMNGDDKVSSDGRYVIVGNEIRVRGAGWVGVTQDDQDTYRIIATDGVTPVIGGVTITVKNNVGPAIASITATGSGKAGTVGTIRVSENAGAVEIGTVTASDPDAASDGRTLSYSLADTHNGLFAIDAAGKIKIANASKLPVGADKPYQLTVRVSDGSNDDVATQTVTVVVTDVPVNPPNSAPKDLNLTKVRASVLEYSTPNTEIGTLLATDANGDALTYTLVNPDGHFAIVGNKLVVGSAGVNFEEAASHQIKVQASDGKGGVTEQVFTIAIEDQTTLNKRGTKKSDKLNGSVQDDILKGGIGNVKDIIKGLAGDDKLYGEGGNDSVLGGDGIDSLYGGAGNDTLKGEAGKDLLKGDAGNDKAYGGLGNDMLYGGAGNDILKGDADNDVLFGEAGNDKLYGGAGSDTFVFNKKASKAANFDRIYDFKSGEDKLFLDNAVFKKLGKLGTFDVPAKLDMSMFKTGRAKDKNDYLVYKNGILFYDADGSGKGGAVEIVKLSGLKVTDIFVI